MWISGKRSVTDASERLSRARVGGAGRNPAARENQAFLGSGQVGPRRLSVRGHLDRVDLIDPVELAAAATAVWAGRRDAAFRELAGYPVVPPHGGWSALVDTRPLKLTPAELSRLLFERGGVAATPMDGWGPSGAHYLWLVFADEPVERLAGLGERFRRAIG
ncbi:hypothetical protein AAH991_18415 [Microbispora sp. ZYX-F-249]|uniref:Aminotransferase class I/II-fold pyridoxal phosphate-dependent enzyme n=1 Tax=Microbispora maris TaxID=3144104 RepID=A0ABV0AP97_9ACTN